MYVDGGGDFVRRSIGILSAEVALESASDSLCNISPRDDRKMEGISYTRMLRVHVLQVGKMGIIIVC